MNKMTLEEARRIKAAEYIRSQQPDVQKIAKEQSLREATERGDIATVNAITKKKLTDAVENWMNSIVRERGYDDVTTCIGRYYNSPVDKFKAESRAVSAWVSAVWQSCYTILDEVLAGKRTAPSEQELIIELPKLTW